VATRISRSSKAAFDAVSTFVQHMTLKEDAKKITSRSEALKKRLKEYLPTAEDAYANEQGSIFLDLPETVEVSGQPYKGMELRRSVGTKFNEETAETILKRKGVLEEALSTFIDQEKVYVLVQEGKITEKDIDKMFEETESFAFWPVKGEVL
jgi:hypothetical protein